MAQHKGAYRAEKRQKELKRQKKQEAKRARHQAKLAGTAEGGPEVEAAAPQAGEATVPEPESPAGND